MHLTSAANSMSLLPNLTRYNELFKGQYLT